MSNNVIRFGKGVLRSTYEQIYQVPVDFIGVVKTLSFCNTTGSIETVSIMLDGQVVMDEREIDPANGVYNIKAFDHILHANDTIEVKASSDSAINFYINGVIAPIDNIGSETQWMKDRWDEWWANMGPGVMEVDWQQWFDDIKQATFVTNNDVDDKIAQEMNTYEISFNSQLSDIQAASDDAVNTVNTHLTNDVSAMDVHGVRVNQTTGYLEVRDTDGWKEISTSELYRLRMETQVIRQNQVSLLIENDINSNLGLDEVGYWYDSMTNDDNFDTLNVFDQRIKVVS